MKRRALLSGVVKDSGILVSSELPGKLADIVRTVQAMGLEGVIAKRRNSPYVQVDRSPHWLKLKLERQQEFVIGGFRPAARRAWSLPSAATTTKKIFDSPPRCALDLSRTFDVSYLLHSNRCRYHAVPLWTCRAREDRAGGGGISADDMKDFVWTRPELVAQIKFVEWTAEGRLRHSAFLGLRTDKRASDVRLEE